MQLARVVIDYLDWPAVSDRFDRPETPFYLDTSHHGSEDDYGYGLVGRRACM